MNKLFTVTLAIFILLLAAGFFIFNSYIYQEKQADPVTVLDYKNATYVIAGQVITLVNGFAETELAPNSASMVITRYFGNELFKDLNGDGRDDAVFLLTQETGGSGSFFYVVAALNTENGYVGSQALLLGDRITPQSTESGPGKQVIVNFVERGLDEPMTTPPSIGKSLHLILDPQSMQFGEVATDFEGEADPKVMALGMKPWVWQQAVYSDGKEIIPEKKDAFTLTFTDANTVVIATDCNTAGGTYIAENNTIEFSEFRTTRMYCEGSQETEFLKLLQETQSFHFTGRGELIFDLKYDSGIVKFR